MTSPQVLVTTAVIYILTGILSCFFGYRLFKVILGFWGFIIGFILTRFIFAQYVGTNDNTILLIAGLVGGVVGIFLFISLFKVGIFALGAMFGYTLVMMFVSAGKLQPDPIILILAAILGGILALLLQRPMIILSTAFGGAFLVVFGVAYFLNLPMKLIDLLENPELIQMGNIQLYLLFISWLILSFFGASLQFKVTGKARKKHA